MTKKTHSVTESDTFFSFQQLSCQKAVWKKPVSRSALSVPFFIYTDVNYGCVKELGEPGHVKSSLSRFKYV